MQSFKAFLLEGRSTDFKVSKKQTLKDHPHLSSVTNISDAIKKHTKYYIHRGRVKNAKGINCGACERFANEITPVIKGAKVISGRDHAWIYHNGKHYDSESPNGVKDYNQLNHFKRESK